MRDGPVTRQRGSQLFCWQCLEISSNNHMYIFCVVLDISFCPGAQMLAWRQQKGFLWCCQIPLASTPPPPREKGVTRKNCRERREGKNKSRRRVQPKRNMEKQKESTRWQEKEKRGREGRDGEEETKEMKNGRKGSKNRRTTNFKSTTGPKTTTLQHHLVVGQFVLGAVT